MNIYLHVEISVRELDSKLLLGTLAGSGTDLYVQTTGSFRNASKYVRVIEVLLKELYA